MFIVLYRWRVKPEFEIQFVESWSEITALLREDYDSLGSRLHCGNDGFWHGYAQWQSAEQRELAFNSDSPTMAEASRKMREAIDESFPEILLEVVADYLVLPEKR